MFFQLSSTSYGTDYRALILPKLCVMVLDHMVRVPYRGKISQKQVSQPQARIVNRENLRLGIFDPGICRDQSNGSLRLPRGGGVLTLCWYTPMCHGFEVHFHHFRYIDGWVIARGQGAQIEKCCGFLGGTQFEQNLVFFFLSEKWYSEGSQNRIFLGIEKVEIAKSAWHIPVQHEIKNPTPPPPGPGDCLCYFLPRHVSGAPGLFCGHNWDHCVTQAASAELYDNPDNTLTSVQRRM